MSILPTPAVCEVVYILQWVRDSGARMRWNIVYWTKIVLYSVCIFSHINLYRIPLPPRTHLTHTHHSHRPHTHSHHPHPHHSHTHILTLHVHGDTLLSTVYPYARLVISVGITDISKISVILNISKYHKNAVIYYLLICNNLLNTPEEQDGVHILMLMDFLTMWTGLESNCENYIIPVQ